MELDYHIADLCVRMETFGRTLKQAEPYRCEKQERADILIRANREELMKVQPHLSEDDCEYLATGASFYRQLLRFDGLMLHASAVALDGKAYLFTAPCGTGKSTHTALWRKAFGERARILNDDKPALRLIDGVWYAYGTPWSGKTDQNCNSRAEVAGICVLRRAEENHIAPMTGARAVFELLDQTPRMGGEQSRGVLLERLDALMKQVPIWQMGCNMDVQAAELSFAAMSKGR